jgi:hypothetical protein
LKVWTHNNGTCVVTDIVLKGTVATFIATIDDLLASASTAEKVLHVVQAK